MQNINLRDSKTNFSKKNLKIIGNNVRALRIKKQWTYEDVSFYSRVNVRSIYQIEAGKVNMRILTIIALANALDVDVTSIFDGCDYEVCSHP